MSKKPKSGTVGAALETTIIFPTKTLIEDLAKAKRDTKKRTQSANGTLGEKIGKAVEDHHLDRKAFSLACQLDAMDDERLHITYHSLLKYCEDLGVTKRATAQEELFDASEGDEPTGKVSDAPKGGRGAKADADIERKPRGPRLVAESPGKDDTPGAPGFKPMH
jgi:hypothetical protein